jgi:hypothetical protein
VEEELEEDLSVASVYHVPNCKAGHCSCYYCNFNKCCRCGSRQLKGIDLTVHTSVMEREWKDKKRPDPGPEYYTDWVNEIV